MFIGKKFQFNAVLLLLFSLTVVFSNSASAADADYEVMSTVSEDKCINILVDTGNIAGEQKFYYNGHVVDAPDDYFSISDAKIDGERVGFIAWKTPNDGGLGEVFVDDESFGSVISWTGYDPKSANSLDYSMVTNFNYQLNISGDHVAYLRLVGFTAVSQAKADAGYKGNPIFHVILDGKDLGEISSQSKIHFNGNNLIYSKLVKGKSHVFANNKDLGLGVVGDFDGKNKSLVNDKFNLYYNGKKVTNLAGMSELSLKNGALSYAKGPVYSANVYYKGKKVGKGTMPKIEGKNFAYVAGSNNKYTLIYNNKKIGNVFDLSISSQPYMLVKNHFAFMQGDVGQSIQGSANIDGKLLNTVVGKSIQISLKEDCEI